jgi:hypothetical protein
VGALLERAYAGASLLKISGTEAKKLREDFPDAVVEMRPHDGIPFLGHMVLRERLWDVFGVGAVAEICRERTLRGDTNEIAVDLVLVIRGTMVSEAIGTAKYFPQNAAQNFGDCVESAWSEALRRCCKKFGVGTQMWRAGYSDEWTARNAVQDSRGRWHRKPADYVEPPVPAKKKARSYELHTKEQVEKAKPEDLDPPVSPFAGTDRPPNDREQASEATPDPDWPEAPPPKNPSTLEELKKRKTSEEQDDEKLPF